MSASARVLTIVLGLGTIGQGPAPALLPTSIGSDAAPPSSSGSAPRRAQERTQLPTAPSGIRGAACAASPSGPVLYIWQGTLRAWPGGETVWAHETLRATALACEADRVAIGVQSGEEREGKILLLTRHAAALDHDGEIPLSGVPEALHLARGRLAAVLRSRRGTTLAMTDASPGARPTQVALPDAVRGLALSPDSESLLVATGRTIRTFKVADGRTWMILPFPEPIGAIAARPGIPRVLVGQGRIVVAIDPKDMASRGGYPDRARAELPGRVSELVWTGDGSVAVARTEDPASLVFLDGEDLSVLDSRAVAASALAPLGVGRVVSIPDSGEDAVTEIALASDRIAAARRPADVRAPAPIEEQPLEAAPAGHMAPASSDVPPPVGAERPSEQAAPIRAAKPASTPEATGSIAQAGNPSSPPATQARALDEQASQEAAEAHPLVPKEQAAARTEIAESLGGTISGVLRGRVDLVGEIVILGPDSLVKEAARLRPDTKDAAATFLGKGLPAGRYRVVPMGKGGAGLACRPPYAAVTIGPDAGARVEFTVLASQ